MTKLGRAFYRAATKSADYWSQAAMRFFVRDLGVRLEAQGMSRADLARKINSSTAYVTKVMRGDVNFTLETMTKLALAVNGKLSVRIVPESAFAKGDGENLTWRLATAEQQVSTETTKLFIPAGAMAANCEFNTWTLITRRAA